MKGSPTSRSTQQGLGGSYWPKRSRRRGSTSTLIECEPNRKEGRVVVPGPFEAKARRRLGDLLDQVTAGTNPRRSAASTTSRSRASTSASDDRLSHVSNDCGSGRGLTGVLMTAPPSRPASDGVC